MVTNPFVHLYYIPQTAEIMKEFWTSLLQIFGRAWWIEVITDNPRCTYYFGPFASGKDAEFAKTGNVEDLEHEDAQGIRVMVKRCKPSKLTICDEVSERGGRGVASPAFSGQF
jgi:hypothetical protein